VNDLSASYNSIQAYKEHLFPSLSRIIQRVSLDIKVGDNTRTTRGNKDQSRGQGLSHMRRVLSIAVEDNIELLLRIGGGQAS